MATLVSFQIARLLLVKLSFDEFNDTFYFFLSTSCSSFKLFATLVNCDKVLQLLKKFEEEYCQARDDIEYNIQKTYDKICRTIALVLLISVEVTILLWLIGRTNGGIESRQLPYKVLQPYDLSNPLTYWISYVHHMVAGVLFAGVSLIIDATITGFMLQLCGQLEILRHRLQLVPDRIRRTPTPQDSRAVESFLLKEMIEHHNHIYSVARALEVAFNSIISVQFYVSSLEICVSIYQLTVRSTKVIDLLMNVFFVTCILGQLLTYCYFGNELAVKSIKFSDALYNIDWMSQSLPFQKSLKLMILRSSKPIEISSGAIVHLTMANFTLVVKFAYSFFNCLKSTAEDS